MMCKGGAKLKIDGAQAVIECLKNEGVEIVFGYPGGQVLPLYDALYKAQFPHILTSMSKGRYMLPMVMPDPPVKLVFALRLPDRERRTW